MNGDKPEWWWWWWWCVTWSNMTQRANQLAEARVDTAPCLCWWCGGGGGGGGSDLCPQFLYTFWEHIYPDKYGPVHSMK